MSDQFEEQLAYYHDQQKLRKLMKLGLIENHLIKLLEKFPDKSPDVEWNWEALSSNPNITLDYVLDHPEKPWNRYLLSKNPAITIKDVIEYPQRKRHTNLNKYDNGGWNKKGLLENPNLTVQDVIQNPKLFKVSGKSSRKSIWSSTGIEYNSTIQGVIDHPNEPWNWTNVSCYFHVTIPIIRHPLLLNKWDWIALSENKSISIQDIIANPDPPWNWTGVSSRKDLTLQIVIDHGELPWNYNVFCAYGKINFQDITDHPNFPSESLDSRDTSPVRTHFPWNWDFLEFNLCLKPSDIINRPDYKHSVFPLTLNPQITIDDLFDRSGESGEGVLRLWDWHSLSKNQNIKIWELYKRIGKYWRPHMTGINSRDDITMENVNSFPDLPWNWLTVVSHPNIHPEDIIYNDKILWNLELWKSFCTNPNITYQTIIDHPSLAWLFPSLSSNLFQYHPGKIKQELTKFPSRSEDNTFMNHLNLWQAHLNFQPGGEGYMETESDWNKGIANVTGRSLKDNKRPI